MVWRKGARCGGAMWCPVGVSEKKAGLRRPYGEVGEENIKSAGR